MLPDITFRTAPATHPADLLSAAPGPDPLVWLRRGDGFVGMGQAARFETTGPGRFRDAEDWWSSVLTRATIEGPSDLPGTGPLAMGAFAFADTSRAPSVLVVPQVVVARYRGREWVTTATVSGSAPHGMPDAAPRVQPEPASGPVPGMVTPQSSPSLLGQWPCPRLEEFPGPVAAADWPDVVRQAIDLIEDNGLDKVVLARSVLARAATRPVATGPAATTPVGVGVGPDGTGLDGTGDATDAGLIDPRAVLDFLVSQYRDTWTFSIDGLIGATPELLARSTRGLVTSRVLAGTIRRSGSDHANLARAAALA
ncbi:MAG: chorismate-binding protein, partial [Bifidobacteriaceae bacterium]|nr:chorismate-binding protein [Bifidobacteriaceae bacterium]